VIRSGSIHFSVLSFAVALLMAGCATVPTRTATDQLSQDEILQRLQAGSIPSGSFTADGTITVTTPTMNQSAGFDVATRGTDSVKINVYGPFGITVGSALYINPLFTAYNALNNTVYRGSPEQQMSRLPFIKDIPFALFIGTLQGRHAFRPVPSVDSFTLREDGSYAFVVPRGNGAYERFLYNAATDRISRCTFVAADGVPLWSVRYYYTTSESGAVVPEQVEVSIPSKGASLLIEYGERSNENSAEEFALPYPDDAEVVTIE
jgi:hypothetical protein